MKIEYKNLMDDDFFAKTAVLGRAIFDGIMSGTVVTYL